MVARAWVQEIHSTRQLRTQCGGSHHLCNLHGFGLCKWPENLNKNPQAATKAGNMPSWRQIWTPTLGRMRHQCHPLIHRDWLIIAFCLYSSLWPCKPTDTNNLRTKTIWSFNIDVIGYICTYMNNRRVRWMTQVGRVKVGGLRRIALPYG